MFDMSSYQNKKVLLVVYENVQETNFQFLYMLLIYTYIDLEPFKSYTDLGTFLLETLIISSTNINIKYWSDVDS